MKFERVERKRKVVNEDTVVTSSFNKNLPEIEVSDVPSKFIAYPKNCHIKFKPYTWGEVKKFNQSKMNVIDNIKFVLDGIECSFDKYSLTVPDFLYIGLMRKISTFGNSKFTLKHICEKCQEIKTETFDATMLEFQDIKAPAVPAFANFESVQFEFMPLTINDYIFLVENALVDDEIAMMAKQCRNMEFKEACEKLYALSPDEGGYIDKIDKAFFHEIKPLKFICNSVIKGTECHHENLVEVEGGDAFVYPFRGEGSGTIKSRISYGT